MKQIVSIWFNRYFSDPQAVFLTLLLAAVFVVIYSMGAMLMPVLASIIIAYLLEGITSKLESYRLPRLLAVSLVFSFFMAMVVLLLFGVMPLLIDQVTQFFGELPRMVRDIRALVMKIPKAYPDFVTEERMAAFLLAFENDMHNKVSEMTRSVLSYSLASIQSVVTLMIYLVLLPILVFFFLKDKTKILAWFVAMLPQERKLAVTVWKEVNMQIGNYIRGKIAEILIVGIATYIAFALFDLRYAVLLAAAVGLSVLVPYIGSVVVTVPVVLVAYIQWGAGEFFYWVCGAYLVIQILDGNVLVPVLFSEVVDMHPVAIVVAVLVFGGLWGFWGVFFAIPLATLVNALIKAWPRTPDDNPVAVEDMEHKVVLRKE